MSNLVIYKVNHLALNGKGDIIELIDSSPVNTLSHLQLSPDSYALERARAK
jgi:hypothetical protein